MLYITEGAVSKWERGASYPDITLISEICRVLDISEHELITASTDTEAQKMKQEARKFRTIRNAWICIPVISYAIALLTCFICNLAVSHTLSWFFIVLTAIICAFTFIPTLSCFFQSKKLLIFALSTCLSICLLLFTCAVYTGGLHWFSTVCIGVSMGYVLVFVPIFLKQSACSRYKFVITFALTFLLTVLLLINLHIRQPLPLRSAIITAAYGFAPLILCALVCTRRFDAFLKAGLCTLLGTAASYFAGYVTNLLFDLNENHYEVDFHNWVQCITGNVHLLALTFLLLLSAVFFGVGIYRSRKQKRQ